MPTRGVGPNEIPNIRKIQERWFIKGELVLETPAHLGNGEEGLGVDMAAFLDSHGFPVLTGDSQAGALRNYLRDYQYGYFPMLELDEERKKESLSTLLFGGISGDEEGEQSPLIIEDALGTVPETLEVRDGVKISPHERTAAKHAKFDFELLEAGTKFSLCFELLLSEDLSPYTREKLTGALALCMRGLVNREVRLGAKKSRGFGRCYLEKGKLWKFGLRKPECLIAYLAFEREAELQESPVLSEGGKAETLFTQWLAEATPPVGDQRAYFELDADLDLPESILIRSSAPSQDAPGSDARSALNAPDAVHLKSRRNGAWQSILSGTSVTGAVRHRALKILRTLGWNEQAEVFVNVIFGPLHGNGQGTGGNAPPSASRLMMEETVVQAPVQLVQQRVRIDSFTGGSFAHALFSGQPAFGGRATGVKIQWRLRLPSLPVETPRETISPPTEPAPAATQELRLCLRDHDSQQAAAGLLLLCLKDLWTEDLSIGGESSVGRGRLCGRTATIVMKDPGGSPVPTSIKRTNEPREHGVIEVEASTRLESLVASLKTLTERVTTVPQSPGEKHV